MGVQAGIPDVMMICHGVHIAIEFKRPGEKPTLEQKAVQGMLHSRGWSVAVAESCEEAKKFVRGVAPVWDGPNGDLCARGPGNLQA